MKTIRARLAALVATAAIAPLLAYGVVSLQLLRSATNVSVAGEAETAAEHAAAEIAQYLDHNIDLLTSVASDLQYAHLSPDQQERIVRNNVTAFPAYSELTLFDADGTPMASSRLLKPTLVLGAERPLPRRPRVAPIQIDSALLPSTEISLFLDHAGPPVAYLVGRLSLEELWRVVDRVRVGGRGHAVLVDEKGRLIGHGDPAMRSSVARGDDLLWHPLIHPRPGATLAGVERYTRQDGVEMLGVARPVGERGWRIIVEQRAVEAFALSTRLERFLVMTVLTGLALTLFIAVVWGRSFVRPIDALMHATRALSDGRLHERVTIAGRDEFAELGRAFNSMADRLVTLQAEAVRQERQATFGRIAAGLVHDLAHPIQNIGNNCRLMLQLYEDPQYRQDFRRMIDREFPAIRRLLEDLRNLARPIPLERFPVDVARLLQETAERINPIAAQAGLSVAVTTPASALAIEGDLFALGRVLQNLLQNALQATPPNGRVWLETRETEGRAVIEIGDTGCGIASERLPHVFDDYVTTKRRGLGLGLAISRRIVEQLGGTIAVVSEVGKGSVFTLSFPAIPAQGLLQKASA
ncbi:MAG: sensor histidine kinase [Vicinamibacteraceae bacterium]